MTRKRLLKMMKSAFLGLVTAVAVGAGLVQACSSLPAVSNDYYNKVSSTGEVEAMYAVMGGSAVAYAEYPCSEGKYEKFEVWYPKEMATAKGRRYPLVVMANGTGVPASRYKQVFEHLASWGFIVVGNQDPESWSGRSTSVTLQFMLSQDKSRGGTFYGHIDTKHIGVAGHSQGGVAVFNAVGRYDNGRQYAAAYVASCTECQLAVNLKWSYKASDMRIPCLFTAGTGNWDNKTIAPLSSLVANMAAMPHDVPAVMARRTGKDHGDMLAEGDAYMTAWFCYWLKGIDAAGKAFKGKNAEILYNARWQDVKRQGLWKNGASADGATN